MTADNTAALRVRLIELRTDALRRLAEAEMIDSGLMRVVADANAFSTARLNDDQGGAGKSLRQDASTAGSVLHLQCE